MANIILHSSKVLNVEVDPQGALEMARRSRGTPRLANRILKRVRDFAQVKYDGRITKEVASFALDLLEVDRYGLDQTDRLLLTTIMEKFQGGPVGLDTLAASIGEDAGTIEDVYEPFLIKSGTTWGWRHRVRSKIKSPESFIFCRFLQKKVVFLSFSVYDRLY